MVLDEFKCDLSIVIPVFNGQDTIIRCLESIFSINWGARSYEVIAVDDCSTDKTIDILSSQVTHHSNLTVIHLPVNSKPGAARNRGIERANGRFIMFVDADDCIESGIVSVLDYSLYSGIDMCHFHIITEYDIPEQVIPERVIISGREFADKFYDLSLDTGYFISYLYSTHFLREIQHPFIEGRVHEDADWCEFHLWNGRKVAHVDVVVYKNFANSTSIMHTLSPQKDADNVMMCYRRLCFAESIESKDSRFKSNIQAHCRLWIKAVFSLRHLSLYSKGSIEKMYSRIDGDTLLYLRQLKWSGFQSVCIYHEGLTKLILSIVHPIATLVRRLK